MDQSALLKKIKKHDCACCSVFSYTYHSFASITWLQQVAVSSCYLSSLTLSHNKITDHEWVSPSSIFANLPRLANHMLLLRGCFKPRTIKITWFIAQCSVPVRCYVPAPLIRPRSNTHDVWSGCLCSIISICVISKPSLLRCLRLVPTDDTTYQV